MRKVGAPVEHYSAASTRFFGLRPPRGSTGFPSLFYEGDAGTFTSFRNMAQLGGTHNKFDYYGGFDAFQSDNSVKMNEFHDDTATANLGYALTSATQLRVLARNSDAAVGTPGPFNFYGIANAGKQSNQDIYLGASLDNRTSGGWHNLVRYGMTRKREEDINFYPAGIQLTPSNNYYGYNTVIDGANGYSDEYPVGRYVRDAKVFQIVEGTNEIHRSLIAEAATGIR